MTSIRFMIAVHCFQFQNRKFSNFSELNVLMDECDPRREIWRVFQYKYKFFNKSFPHQFFFFFNCQRFSSNTGPYFDPCVKKYATSFSFCKKIQTSSVNKSIIKWIRNAKFLEYRFKRTRKYLGRFSNALVHSQRGSSKSPRCAITNLYHKFLSGKDPVDSFQKIDFSILWFTAKNSRSFNG